VVIGRNIGLTASINYYYKLKCIAAQDDGTIDYFECKNVQKCLWAKQIIIYL